MKLEKFKKNEKQKKIVIGAIIGLILLVGGITLYRTFALYEEKKEFNVLRGRVPAFSKENGDIELSVLMDGESSTEFPDKNSDAIVESITCDNGATGTWDYSNWSINIGNLSKSKTTCTISFKANMIAKLKKLIGSESEVQTVDEFLANADDVDKLIVSTNGMNYVVENALLKDLIKSSTNYTTAIAKKLLSSEAISEEEKYKAGLPCYVYKKGKNLFGNFSFKISSSSSNTQGYERGAYYQLVADAGGSYVTAISNNVISTKNYQYLEMYSNHRTTLNGLSGANILGLSNDQEINNFSQYKSEKYATAESTSTLTLKMSGVGDEYYLKVKVAHGGEDLYYAADTRIITIALY